VIASVILEHFLEHFAPITIPSLRICGVN